MFQMKKLARRQQQQQEQQQQTQEQHEHSSHHTGMIPVLKYDNKFIKLGDANMSSVDF